jgi:hypothetical protein
MLAHRRRGNVQRRRGGGLPGRGKAQGAQRGDLAGRQGLGGTRLPARQSRQTAAGDENRHGLSKPAVGP